MSRHPFAAILLFAIAVVLGACGSSGQQTVTTVPPPDVAASASSTETGAGVYVFMDGDTQPLSRPVQVQNGQQPIQDVEWTSWGGDTAIGAGQLQANDCNPNCADGTVTPTPATIELSTKRSCGGRTYYTSGLLRQGSRVFDFSFVVLDCDEIQRQGAADPYDEAPPESEGPPATTTEQPDATPDDATDGVVSDPLDREQTARELEDIAVRTITLALTRNGQTELSSKPIAICERVGGGSSSARWKCVTYAAGEGEVFTYRVDDETGRATLSGVREPQAGKDVPCLELGGGC